MSVRCVIVVLTVTLAACPQPACGPPSPDAVPLVAVVLWADPGLWPNEPGQDLSTAPLREVAHNSLEGAMPAYQYVGVAGGYFVLSAQAVHAELIELRVEVTVSSRSGPGQPQSSEQIVRPVAGERTSVALRMDEVYLGAPQDADLVIIATAVALDGRESRVTLRLRAIKPFDFGGEFPCLIDPTRDC